MSPRAIESFLPQRCTNRFLFYTLTQNYKICLLRYKTEQVKVNNQLKGQALVAPLIILSGPSGVGKTTTTDHLLARLSLLTRVITTTTRRPRAGERHGIHYFFVSHEAFAQLAAAHAFLEVNNFGGQSYGTPRSMLTFLSKGMPRIVLPDVHGARALKAYVPDAVCIWLEAPLPILTQRLSARSSEPLEKQQERITIAHAEIAQAHSSNLYTHVIDMTNFEQAEDEIEGIIKKLLKI